MAGKHIDLLAQPTFVSELATWSKRLDECDWFHNVGTGELPGVNRAASWDEAMRLSSLDPYCRDWDDMLNAIHNAITARALHHDPARYNADWNDIVREVDKHTDPLATASLRPVLDRLQLSHSILAAFSYCLCGYFLSVAFFLCSPDASMDSTILEYYMQGHFPCGYHGTFPNGRLIVY